VYPDEVEKPEREMTKKERKRDVIQNNRMVFLKSIDYEQAVALDDCYRWADIFV
jgi:hypothetical protein